MKVPATLTHAELCQIARRWLLYPHSKGGHGCQIAFVEPRIGFLSGEIPDAIGFRAATDADGSVVVECKASRSDFLADCRKSHRQCVGMGRWRYFLCPENMINPGELPPGWGLLVVGRRKTVRALAGAVAALPAHSGTGRWPDVAAEMGRFALEHDAFRESLMLTKMLHRVGDAEAVNQRIREAEANVHRLSRTIERYRADADRLRIRLFAAENKLAGDVP